MVNPWPQWYKVYVWHELKSRLSPFKASTNLHRAIIIFILILTLLYTVMDSEREIWCVSNNIMWCVSNNIMWRVSYNEMWCVSNNKMWRVSNNIMWCVSNNEMRCVSKTGKEVTYGELRDHVHCMALYGTVWHSLGLRKGSVVCFSLDRSLQLCLNLPIVL